MINITGNGKVILIKDLTEEGYYMVEIISNHDF